MIQGRVISKFKQQDGSYKSLVIVEGSYFGEVDIILHRERLEAAFAAVKCEIWKITKQDFFEILDEFDSVRNSFI